MGLAERYELSSGARTAGLFCPVTSLPDGECADATGVMGPVLLNVIDTLKKAGFSSVQFFPPNPGDKNDCPYNSLGGSAGNLQMIDSKPLADAGLIPPRQLDLYQKFATQVDYYGITSEGRQMMTQLKRGLLAVAFNEFTNSSEPRIKQEQAAFKQWREGVSWLDDYAAFVAISGESRAGMQWEEWTPSARDHTPHALRKARGTYQYQLEQFVQWTVRQQAAAVKQYATERGVAIITDKPAYSRPDSADVWGNQELYLMQKDAKGFRLSSGCPPDYFATRGQMWGHFLPNWEDPAARQKLLRLNAEQITALLDFGHLVRLDHARAIGSRWAWSGNTSIPEPKGEEMPGPGQAYFDYLRQYFNGTLPVFAEDLGEMPQSARELLLANVACMGVVQFAPWGNGDDFARSEHNPANGYNRFVYAGTHDNPPTRHWFEEKPTDSARDHIRHVVGAADLQSQDAPRALLEYTLRSPASHVIAMYADILSLGKEGTLNVPNEVNDTFWRHRIPSFNELEQQLLSYKDVIAASGRAAVLAAS